MRLALFLCMPMSHNDRIRADKNRRWLGTFQDAWNLSNQRMRVEGPDRLYVEMTLDHSVAK